VENHSSCYAVPIEAAKKIRNDFFVTVRPDPAGSALIGFRRA
jgi:hypothetical protein